MRTQLKKISFIVIISRFVRSLSFTWNKICTDYQQEQVRSTLLQSRKSLIDHYPTSTQKRKLQIGTGVNFLPGWLNTDIEPTTDEIIYLNALEKFPLPDREFDYVFSEHMIEHINYSDGLFMLSECFRILKSGGKIRIATPDIEKIIGLYGQQKTKAQERYIEWSATESLGLYKAEKSELQKRRREWDIAHDHFMTHFPNCVNDSVCFIVNNFFRSYGHQFIYDAKTLKGALEDAGFIDISRFSPGTSNDKELQNIESHANQIGEEMNLFETLILEGTRP
jgi:SAM-dependent methyltransferase